MNETKETQQRKTNTQRKRPAKRHLSTNRFAQMEIESTVQKQKVRDLSIVEARRVNFIGRFKSHIALKSARGTFAHF